MFQLLPLQELETRLRAQAFSAESRSSIATVRLEALAVILSALLEVLLQRRAANSQAARGPSTQLAPHRAAMPVLEEQEHPVDREPVPDSVLVLALEHPERDLASADHHVQAAHHRQPVKRPVRRAPLREAAADARSIPRPKKAQ